MLRMTFARRSVALASEITQIGSRPLSCRAVRPSNSRAFGIDAF
jgi:hypothetical protein